MIVPPEPSSVVQTLKTRSHYCYHGVAPGLLIDSDYRHPNQICFAINRGRDSVATGVEVTPGEEIAQNRTVKLSAHGGLRNK